MKAEGAGAAQEGLEEEEEGCGREPERGRKEGRGKRRNSVRAWRRTSETNVGRRKPHSKRERRARLLEQLGGPRFRENRGNPRARRRRNRSLRPRPGRGRGGRKTAGDGGRRRGSDGRRTGVRVDPPGKTDTPFGRMGVRERSLRAPWWALVCELQSSCWRRRELQIVSFGP